MNWNHYYVTLTHDKGRQKFKTYAPDIWKAVAFVIDLERAPVTAVESVERVNPNANLQQSFKGGRW